MFRGFLILFVLIVGAFGKPKCDMLSPVKGKCGSDYGRCNRYLDTNSRYCNEATNNCGSTHVYSQAQSSDQYDWQPRSCDKGVDNEGQDCWTFGRSDCTGFFNTGDGTGKCKWCGENGYCCRQGWDKNGCSGTMGGNDHHSCVEGYVREVQPTCTSSADCDIGSFCEMSYGDSGFCQSCRSLPNPECKNENNGLKSEGANECQFMCENNGCYSTKDCQARYKDTSTFCDFEEDRRGYCTFCSKYPDGCFNDTTGVSNEKGQSECQHSCVQQTCQSTSECPASSFCNFENNDEGVCTYCTDVNDCKDSSLLINDKGRQECKQNCGAVEHFNIWNLIEANENGCITANEMSNDNVCSGIANRVAKVVLNASEPNYHVFCEFLGHELNVFLPVMPVGPETCKALTDCVVHSIRDHKLDVDECVSNAFEGLEKDVANNMKRLNTRLARWGSKLGRIENLVGNVACNTDPLRNIKDKIAKIKASIKAFKELPNAIAKAVYIVKDVLAVGKNALAPFKDDAHGGYPKSSVLLSIDATVGTNAFTKSSSVGVFITFDSNHISKIKQLVTQGAVSFGVETAKKIIDLIFHDDSGVEFGFYQAFADGQTSALTNIIAAGAGATIQFLNGDYHVWGGYGFDISVGCGVKVPEWGELDLGFSAGIVFSATPEDAHFEHGRQKTNQFIGFMFGADLSSSLDSNILKDIIPLPECTISRSCGYIQFFNETDYSRCDVGGIDEARKELASTTQKIKDDFADLMEKCTTAWTCRWEDCKDAYWEAGQNAIECHDNRVAKCQDYHFGNGCLRPGKCLLKDVAGYWDATKHCADSLNPFKPVDCVPKTVGPWIQGECMAMDGLNCGMQVQTRTCTSGTWDACTNEDMKQVLPCNDPDKEIEGCDDSEVCVTITTGKESNNDGTLTVTMNGVVTANGNYGKGKVVIDTCFNSFDILRTMTISNPSSNAWTGQIKITQGKMPTFIECDGCSGSAYYKNIVVDGNSDSSSQSPTQCFDGAICSITWSIQEQQGNGYKLLKQGMECKSSDSKLGNFRSLEECAAACQKTTGCNFFVYGIGRKSGACYWEFTKQNSCIEGWEEDLYDFYEMAGECRKGELPLNETKKCQLSGYTCTALDGPACCQGRIPETRPCVPCDETRLRKAEDLLYSIEGKCDASDSNCDAKCGCGFKHTSSNLSGRGKSWSNPGKGIKNCANACRHRRGCTSFEYNHAGNENYSCGTYTGGSSNIGGRQSSSWTSCIQA